MATRAGLYQPVYCSGAAGPAPARLPDGFASVDAEATAPPTANGTCQPDRADGETCDEAATASATTAPTASAA